ncbi:transporter substrate-binding domain-containing protein [Desulfovibrio subterraneus]|uniref:substrate-binding periplasmic protein n=1 Tax=Desulfovibrio subterraneus TaxID=2718620 RepID=UPI0022B89BFB|nr:transporter substrate-binding domain-containing protein [Desulfovibrio subterraneus]WBF69103.1 transporter substrate-binding domain-containing protein [Desulfovibrio subterraneus]
MSRQWKPKHFILLLIAFFYSSPYANAQDLTIFFDIWPPYNYIESGKTVGISTELIETTLQNSNIKYKLVQHPFKRAILTVETTPYTMVYTVARIPQREDAFTWIGPLHPRKVYLYKLKERTDIQIANVEDIKKYHTGALSGGSVEQFFIANGFHTSRYYLANSSEQLVRMLFAERIDLIPGDQLDIAFLINSMEYDYSRIEVAYLLDEEGGYYLAANKNTPHDTLEKLQKSLNKVLATGFKDEIIKKYVKQLK